VHPIIPVTNSFASGGALPKGYEPAFDFMLRRVSSEKISFTLIAFRPGTPAVEIINRMAHDFRQKNDLGARRGVAARSAV
jgi:hypothetical protein